MLDPSVPSQSYIEDCEVCCRPISFEMAFQDRELTVFEVSGLED